MVFNDIWVVNLEEHIKKKTLQQIPVNLLFFIENFLYVNRVFYNTLSMVTSKDKCWLTYGSGVERPAV